MANAIYVVPLLQAEIDEMSGILHCEETDYTTAYSYFLEAFEAYDQAKANKLVPTTASTTSSITCLKYMILCKVLNETVDYTHDTHDTHYTHDTHDTHDTHYAHYTHDTHCTHYTHYTPYTSQRYSKLRVKHDPTV